MNFSYCSKCVLPSTRPNLNILKSGICDACSTSNEKKLINWENRQKDLKKLIKSIKSEDNKYDCIIPVSGGKDSTWQVIKALELGLKPICITWKTPSRNSLGAKNLQNLIDLGVDHIDFSINPKVEKVFTLKTFRKMGSPVIPMHMALHALPLQYAINFKIPLIIWGENSAYEYGGYDESLKGLTLTHNWLMKYGVTNGTKAEDWIDNELSKEQLYPYIWPSDYKQKEAGVTAIFLGYYFKWDPVNTFQVAKNYGFTEDNSPKVGYYNFADIDDEFLITIHHWMKWYKFGFTRLWDNLSIEIRNGRLTRDEAIDIIRTRGDETPIDEINKFCKYLDITIKEFFSIANSFRNKNIWVNEKNKFILKDFLIDGWDWNK